MKQVNKTVLVAALALASAATAGTAAAINNTVVKIQRIDIRNNGTTPYAFFFLSENLTSVCSSANWVAIPINNDLGKGMLSVAQSAMLADLSVKVGFPATITCVSDTAVIDQLRIGL